MTPCHLRQAQPAVAGPRATARLVPGTRQQPPGRRPLTPAAASHSPVAPAARVQQQQQRQQRSVAARGASAAAAAAAAAAASQALLPAQLQALGGFILSCACSLFLLAAVPAMIALARMAHRAEAVLRIIEAELPDTAATMKVTGADISETLSSFGLNQGGPDAAAQITSSSSGGSSSGAPASGGGGQQQAGGGVGAAATAVAVAAAAKQGGRRHAKLEAFLVSRAKTDIALLPAVRGALRDTTTTLRRARFGMGVASVAVGAARAGEYVQYVLARRAWEAGEEEARRREQVAALQALAERSRG